MREECESFQDRSGRPDMVMGQSIVLSEIKTEVLLENDDPAGFLSVVEIGKYFMAEDTGEKFYAKACREYTLPRSDGSSQPKGWIQGSTKIGPVLEVTTSCLYGKYGIEIRIWSLSEDNTQSWVRISCGSNKFVMDSNNTDTEVPEDLPEEQASVTTDCEGFCSQIKGESKTAKKRTC